MSEELEPTQEEFTPTLEYESMYDDTEIALKKIPGVGPTTIKKLKDHGIESAIDLASQKVETLIENLGCTRDAASKYIRSAHELLKEHGYLDKTIVNADELLKRRKEIPRLTTGSEQLDLLLLGPIQDVKRGGIETESVTEFYGQYSAGKSQICHTLAVTASLPLEEFGLNSSTIYIDTESTFRAERVEQIAVSRGLDADKIKKNIYVFKVYDSDRLEAIINELGKYIEQCKARLIIIDSIIHLHRGDFTGRGTLADRQQRLNNIMHKLRKVAETYKVAVVITNQVQSSPDTFFGDPIKPTGGNIIGHNVTYRISLKKSGENIIAKMVDSPTHPYSDIRFTVNEKGVTDIEDKREKSEDD